MRVYSGFRSPFVVTVRPPRLGMAFRIIELLATHLKAKRIPGFVWVYSGRTKPKRRSTQG